MTDPTLLHAPAASAPGWRRALRLAWRISVGLALAAFTLLLAAWLALHWAILPHIDRWRPMIERETGAAIGVKLRIGSIAVRSGGWVPVVELRDVELQDAQQRTALHLTRVVASVSARSMAVSLASLELRLAQLLVEGARLEARRDTAGRIFVAGFELGGARTDGGAATDWVLHQGEIAILGATLRWTDEQRGAPPLELDAVDLVLRNTLRTHALRLDATPPAGWGDRFTLRGRFRQPLLGQASDWRRWSGQAYADAPRADASQLRAYVDLPFELRRGVGALRAWLELREGVPEVLTLDAALRSAELQLAADLEPLVVEELAGRLQAQRRADGSGSIGLRRFGFVTGEGVRWQPGDLDLAWRRAPDGKLAGGEFTAERLDLALVADTATRLPLPAPVRRLLDEARPQGIANAVRASWSGPLDAPARYKLQTRLSAVAVAAAPPAAGRRIGRPGFANADIELTATESGGEARLSMKDGTLDLPGVFAEPVIALDDMQAQLAWRVEAVPGAPPALQVQLRDVQFANADAQGELSATWSSGRDARLPGRLELDGTLARGQALRAARYLPLALPEGARRYVEQAVQGGTIAKAGYRFNGELADFARFGAGAPGEFHIAIALEDVTLAYAPVADASWPPLTQARGEIVFDRRSFELRNAHGRIYGVELGALRGAIADLRERPLLTLETVARGPLADMLRFVNSTPAGSGLRGALAEATASGDGELRLALKLPIGDPSRSALTSSLALPGNELRLRNDWPPLAAASGRIAFSEQGVSRIDARARLLGGEAALEGGAQADGALHLALQGRASAEALRQASEPGSLARAVSVLSGQAAYRLALVIDPRGPADFELTSDLAGLAVELPPPFAKRADSALALRVRGERLSTPAGAAPQDQIQVELGSLLRANFVRELAGESPRVLRGGIGIAQPAPTPPSGVAAVLELAHLDLDAWVAAAARLGADAGAPGGAAPSAASAYLPTQIGLKAQSLVFSGQRLTQVSAGLSRLEGSWRANVDAEQLSGYAEFEGASAGGTQPGRLRARLARLALQRSESDEVTRLLDRQPASVPALDIVVDELHLRGRALGRLEVLAVNRGAPVREWQLQRLNLTVPEAKFAATGRWAADAQAAPAPGALAARRASFEFKLDIADSGALLGRLGTPEAIRGGRGTVTGEAGWTGSPLQPDFPSLTGQFNVAIEQGQFLQAQTGGAARLLSVLSLQGLIRRLTFDFRDLSEDGFAFDSVTGDVAIARGVASTNNLVMRGAQAAVLLEGRADANTETQDLRVYVVPEINLGAASLAVAAVNPVVGLSTFVAQLFLREPLAQANTREFRIVGSWTDPKIESVERQPGQAAPRIAAPAGSSAGTPPSAAAELAR